MNRADWKGLVAEPDAAPLEPEVSGPKAVGGGTVIRIVFDPEEKTPASKDGVLRTFNLHRIRDDRDGSIHVCDGGTNHYVIRESGAIHRTRSCEEGCVFFSLRKRRQPEIIER